MMLGFIDWGDAFFIVGGWLGGTVAAAAGIALVARRKLRQMMRPALPGDPTRRIQGRSSR